MSEAGYFAQKSGSPTGFALVVLGHAAVLGALVMLKGPEISRAIFERTIVTTIPVQPDPDPVPPPDARTEQRQQPTVLDRSTRVLPTDDLVIDQRPADPPRFPEITAERPIEIAARPELPPVRREAEIIGRNLQPPYPDREIRAQRGGTVRVRVTIGADGRVRAIERISATSDAFWSATERHARASWRFQPATLDGRPVESTKVMTVTFRIDDI